MLTDSSEHAQQYKTPDQLLISSFSIPVNSLWLFVSNVNCNAQDKHWKVKKI